MLGQSLQQMTQIHHAFRLRRLLVDLVLFYLTFVTFPRILKIILVYAILPLHCYSDIPTFSKEDNFVTFASLGHPTNYLVVINIIHLCTHCEQFLICLQFSVITLRSVHLCAPPT